VVKLYTCMLLFWGFISRRPLIRSTSYVALNIVLSVCGKWNRIRTEAVVYFKLGLIIFVCWNVPRKTKKNLFRDGLLQRCTQPGRQVAMAVKFCTVASDICDDSMWNLLHVTLLASRIFRWLPDVWRIFCIPTLLLDIFFRNVQNMWRWDIIASTVKRPWAGQLRNNGSIPVQCKISLSSPKRQYRFWGLSPLFSLDMWDCFFSPQE
jgi:hypothetical protein